MKIVRTVCKNLFLILVSFISVFPFYWMIVGMTNESKDITMGKLTFGNAFLTNVTNAFEKADLWRAFFNSAQLAIVITFFSLLICSVAGYAFVVFPSRGKEILFMVLVASMMVPFATKLIPMFRMFSNMKLLNTFFNLFLPAEHGELSEGDDRGGACGRVQRVSDFCAHLCADDEVDVCGGRDLCLYGELE